MTRSPGSSFGFALLWSCLCIWLQLQATRAAIHSRAGYSANSVVDDAYAKGQTQAAPELPSAAPAFKSATVNSDFVDKMSWRCANNASCLYALGNSVLQSYRRGETVKLGFFDLVKLQPPSKPSATSSSGSTVKETGRGMSSFVDFISGNAIRLPVGPMLFSVQRAEDNGDFIEIALLKKAATQGRRGGDDGGLLGGGGGGGGLLSGGGGGGGGGGIRHRKNQDKKQFQMYIPMYLAATTFGWTMVAAKAVGLLTLKALAISKLAFVVAAMVVIKKLMDNASEKMMYQYPEHTPYMMPYSMDYPMHTMGGGEIATSEMYPAAMHLAAAAPLAHQGHPGLESVSAESNLHHSIASVHNNTQVMAALNAAGLGHNVKRDDSWIAKKWMLAVKRSKFPNRIPYSAYPTKFRNGEALAVAAAAAVVEKEVDEIEAEQDDIFNEEESIQNTLEFFGMESH